MNTDAHHFFRKARKWREEFPLLREIISENQSLEEKYKWMHPCYTFQENNIVLIHGFKEYCALLFHKGAILSDPQGILIRQTLNVQTATQVRFTSIEEILKLRIVLKDYINEAIEKSGVKIELKNPVPEEFKKILEEDTVLNKAFYYLTPGRQKGYLYYFNQAKQSKTREARILKFYQHILEKKGLDD